VQRVSPDSFLGRLLTWCRRQEASDLHGQADRPFFIRCHGRLSEAPTHQFPVPSHRDLLRMLRETFTPTVCERVETDLEVDVSFYHEADRYRANFSKQQGQQSFSFRHVPQQRLGLDDLQLPDSLRDILDEPRGLVLITGPTGQGKSTTARALIQEINETRAVRIITIEDPIEYIFEPDQSLFEQREVGIDTPSFSNGIRNAMRQDPNVIFVGEIRDRESIFAALQAAETGHLVVTTLHADSVPHAISRLRQYYPSTEQDNVSALLARNLHTILCQRLIPNREGTRTPCLEIMKRDKGIQDAIASNDLTLLAGVVEASVHQGMHSFDQYLFELLAAGIVTRETAEHYSANRHKLDLSLRGISQYGSILKPDKNR
jgi:twitching motility protein PilT